MAVNNSMACGREAVGIGNWEEDQPQCWVLPAWPLRRGPASRSRIAGRVENDISQETKNLGYEDLWRQKGGAKHRRRRWATVTPMG